VAQALDEVKRLTFARILVAGRVRNQRALLRRLNRSRKDGAIAEVCVQLARVLRRLQSAESVSQCMGFEGEAGALYWPALGRALPDGFKLTVRRRRPAPDPINAVLSIMSGLLSRDIRVMAQRAGLHIGFGNLHAVEEGEEALVYDLIEEFRAPVAEAAALALFNRGAFKPEMFLQSGQGVRLDRAGWAAAIRGYEAWVARPIRSPRSGRRVLWRGLMFDQAQAYAAHCEGRETYRPYVLDH
jgi:CRISPR-associated protein Cas1